MDQGVFNRFKFPDGTGIPVDGYKFIVVMNHIPLVDRLINGWTRSAQVTVTFTEPEKMNMRAEQISIQAMSEIPPHVHECVTGSYIHNESWTMSAFAIYPHGHGVNVRQKVWLKHHNSSENDLLLEVDPRGNEHFYSIDEPALVAYGDEITLECLFDSTDRNEPLVVG